MLKDSVTVTVTIAASAETVWNFLIIKRDSWWPEMQFDAPVVEAWVENGKHKHAEGVVTQCEADRLLAFVWHEPGWQHMLNVTISLASMQQGTTVTVTESGFVQAQTPPTLPTEHEHGWFHHVMRLKEVCEASF